VSEDSAPDSSNANEPLSQPLPARMLVRMPQRQPIAIYILLGLTIFIYALQYLTSAGLLDLGRCPFFLSPDIPACYGMKFNDLIAGGQLWRLITPVLLHASILHIGFNMYALYSLGPELERMFGHVSFVALYLLSGFAGVVLSFLLTSSRSLGASTAIFGLLAAHGIFAYRNQRIFGRRAQAALRSIIQIAGINLLIGLSPGIDNWGHLGGLLGGLLFCGLAAPVYEIREAVGEYRLANTTPPGRVWLASGLVLLIFGGLAALKVLAG
jgi:rhomboid protease GluP